MEILAYVQITLIIMFDIWRYGLTPHTDIATSMIDKLCWSTKHWQFCAVTHAIRIFKSFINKSGEFDTIKKMCAKQSHCSIVPCVRNNPFQRIIFPFEKPLLVFLIISASNWKLFVMVCEWIVKCLFQFHFHLTQFSIFYPFWIENRKSQFHSVPGKANQNDINQRVLQI